MPTSLNYYQSSLSDLELTNYITEKDSKIQTNSEKEQYKNIHFYPCSTKEWVTSIYSFNKSSSKSLISNEFLLNKLVKSYCNMLQKKIKILFKRRRDNKIRYSANKIYTSRAELQHTNSKLLITLYTYNKQKSSLEQYIRKLVTLVKFRKIVVDQKPVLIPNHKNRLLHLLKRNFFIFKKWNIAFFKKTTNLFNYSLIANLKKKYFNFYNIPSYNTRLLKKLFRLQKTLFNSTKDIHFNTSKFSSLALNFRNLGLISLLEKLYNKEVKINLVELRAVHLNSDVFSSAVALKLRDRKNKAVSILRKAVLQMVKIPDLHTLITFDANTKPLDKNTIIKTIKQQVVSGVRFEASGRLTRRLTAMRAVFKYRYAGSLKNIRSSFNRESSTMLRGYFKSNLQYSLINSKTRNGTFGLKGWISSHSFILSPNLQSFDLQPYFNFIQQYSQIAEWLLIIGLLSILVLFCYKYRKELSLNMYSSTRSHISIQDLVHDSDQEPAGPNRFQILAEHMSMRIAHYQATHADKTLHRITLAKIKYYKSNRLPILVDASTRPKTPAIVLNEFRARHPELFHNTPTLTRATDIINRLRVEPSYI
jgi:hypothetical protein